YAETHPHVINLVTDKARVFVPDVRRTTSPEPDLAVYRDFPHAALPHVHWRDVSPVLVVDVLGGEDAAKDLERNVELYLRVPRIREYWVVDIRADATRPTLLAHRRRADRWSVKAVPFGTAYTTRLLPGLHLVLNPRGGAPAPHPPPTPPTSNHAPPPPPPRPPPAAPPVPGPPP